jgi:DNA-binding NtrC family response regulator
MELPWPGNVRELRGAVEFAIFRAGPVTVLQGDHITQCLCSSVRDYAAGVAPVDSPMLPLAETTANHERGQANEALRRKGGDHKQAARLLRISPATLYRKLATRQRQS